MKPYIKTLTLKTKLYIFVLALLVLSCLVVGVPSYFIAKRGLDNKGEIILKNSVKAALQLIDSKDQQMKCGNITLTQAQEDVKQYLIGKRNPDGTRQMNSSINLGKHGYFIVYSLNGIEIMHPSLEGKDVWSVKDYSKKPFNLVQDQVAKGKNGGGFSYYEWLLPNSDKAGEKVSYSELDHHWNWIVVASSYMKDYNSEANNIMMVMMLASIMLVLLGSAFAFGFIRSFTQPLKNVLQGMRQAENGMYVELASNKRNDEMGTLVNGFNRMVSSVNIAYDSLVEQEQKVSYYAYYDQVTGLSNRNFFKEQVNARIQSGVSLGYIVLVQTKEFESLTSLYGSDYSESFMKLLGGSIVELRLENSIVARVAPNELAIWLQDLSEEAYLNRLLTTRSIILQKLEKEGYGRLNSFHISYATYPIDDDNYQGCMQKARIAMQYSKRSNLYTPVAYKSEFHTDMELEARMLALAEHDLQQRKFTLHYQGKWNLSAQCFCGVEALARWKSEELGNVSPCVFIPLLTRANLMSTFSEFILEKALDDYPLIEAEFGTDATVSINIPHDFFYKDDFVGYVEQQIKSRGIKPQNVILEITEDTLIESLELVHEISMRLRAIGVRVSLDDFGTGYSSLKYLMNIQFDEIKIDKSFIDNLQKDEKYTLLFTQIVQIAKTFNTSVVAEGVEKAEQLELIQPAGCNIIQGYLYSKPKALK